MRAFLETASKQLEQTVKNVTTPSKPNITQSNKDLGTTQAQKNKELLRGLRSQNKKLKHLYTVLSKSKKEIEDERNILRSFAHQVLPNIIPLEKAENECLNVTFMVKEYENSKATIVASAIKQPTKPTSSASIDVDLLGLNTETASQKTVQNTVEIELRKELSEMEEMKNKILAKFREAMKKLRSLQQKYTTLSEQSKNNTNNDSIDARKMNTLESKICELRQKLEKESLKRIKLQENVEKMDAELADVEAKMVEERQRAKDEEQAKLIAQKRNTELIMELETSAKLVTNASKNSNTVDSLKEQMKEMNIRMKEMKKDVDQLPMLENKVDELEIEKTTLLKEKSSIEGELDEVRELYKDSRKRLGEIKNLQSSVEGPEDVNQVNPLISRVQSLETENKKLLAKGKELYNTHRKLKKEYHLLQENSSKVESLEMKLKDASSAIQTKSEELEAKIEEHSLLQQKLKDEIAAHKTTTESHADELKKVASQQSSNETASVEAKMRIENDLAAAVKELHEMKLNAKSTNESLSKKVEEVKKLQLLNKEQMDTIEKLKQNLIHASSTTESELSKLKKVHSEMLLQVETSATEKATLTKKVEDLKSDHINALKVADSTAKDKLNALNNKLKELKSTIIGEKEKQKRLNEKINEDSKEHEKAVLRLNTYWKKEIDTAKSSTSKVLQTLEENIANLTSKLSKTEENCKKLKNDVFSLEKRKAELEKQIEKNQQEWQERMSAQQASVDEMKKKVLAANKRTEEQRFIIQESTSSSAQKLCKVQGELRVAHERIERLLKTNREKEQEHQERMGALQRSLEEMRHQAASVNAEQSEMDAIQAALNSKQAALEDVKKTDRRIISDLKREMSKILRQNKMEKEEQIIIAEKALNRLRQEEDRGSELEETVIMLRKDLAVKSKEVDMAKLQIEQLSVIAMSHDTSTGTAASNGLLSWFSGTSSTPRQKARKR
jgi:chromosome segregation ATPase